ncbi:hypothetical protein NPIL_617111 [Nephila pilipes]|uniref:Uncharacterized protein n=1 Tax=Nephila pilipes TaxID=299642 RepID=A0A8X6QJC5_NEPPI|nr:hypothetical protein NPIL_617111 [Nephila pilipes]
MITRYRECGGSILETVAFLRCLSITVMYEYVCNAWNNGWASRYTNYVSLLDIILSSDSGTKLDFLVSLASNCILSISAGVILREIRQQAAKNHSWPPTMGRMQRGHQWKDLICHALDSFIPLEGPQ